MTDESRTRAVVAERSAMMCEARLPEVCRGPVESMHHRWKRSQGGLWSPANILGVCGHGTIGCHGYIEANPVSAMRRGLWLRGISVGLGQVRPDTVPVQMYWRGMKGHFLLHDDGSITWLSKVALERLA